MVDEPEEIEEDLPDEGGPQRPWLLIVLALVLAALAALAGVQWKLAVDREEKLKAETRLVYKETEELRTRAAQAQQRLLLLEQQLSALTSEREGLTKRVIQLEDELQKVRRGARPAAKKPAAPPAPQKR